MNDNSSLSIIEIGEEIIKLVNCTTLYSDIVTVSAITTNKMEELVNSISIVALDFISNYDESNENLWSIYNDIQYFCLILHY